MLCDCFDPCFQMMLRLPDALPAKRTGLRDAATHLLEKAEHLALRRYDPATVETARRLVEVWMDEVALRMTWEGRAVWLRDPMQRRWRKGRSGGDWFFEEILRLSPHHSGDAEIAEVALRCLGFGFRGRLYNDSEGLSREHRRLAEQFGYTAIPCTFPPDPRLSRENRLSRCAGLFLTGVVAVVLLSCWGLWNHSLYRNYQDDRGSAENESTLSRERFGDVYGEQRGWLTPDDQTRRKP